MTDSHIEIPELGDTVEFKARGEYGGMLTLRGEIIEALKNGKFRVRTNQSFCGDVFLLSPEKIFVLSKGT